MLKRLRDSIFFGTHIGGAAYYWGFLIIGGHGGRVGDRTYCALRLGPRHISLWSI